MTKCIWANKCWHGDTCGAKADYKDGKPKCFIPEDWKVGKEKNEEKEKK